jgi:hypothetical protein
MCEREWTGINTHAWILGGNQGIGHSTTVSLEGKWPCLPCPVVHSPSLVLSKGWDRLESVYAFMCVCLWVSVCVCERERDRERDRDRDRVRERETERNKQQQRNVKCHQRTVCGSLSLYSSTMWALKNKLRLSGLITDDFNSWAIIEFLY